MVPPIRPAHGRWATRLAALFLALALADGAQAADPPHPRVLLISIDGLRPDVLLRADAPAIRSLMRKGSFCLWATTTAVAVTLPSHTSMLTGVEPSKHRIIWNSDPPPGPMVYPAWPTLLEMARAGGYTTAMAAGKSKFVTLAKPGTLDWASVPSQTVVSDSSVTAVAVGWIAAHAPQVLFVHLPGVDTAGHSKGWGSDPQLAAVAEADRCVGRLLAALARRGLRDSTVVLVTADHGGTGKSHGSHDPRSRFIPWIIAGPGIRAGFDLTLAAHHDIRTEDTCATLCEILGLRPPRALDGHPVREAFEAPHGLEHAGAGPPRPCDMAGRALRVWPAR